MESKAKELSDRLLHFSIRIIKLVEALPKKTGAKHIGNQLLRSGTSPGANYEEARGAESHADFIHKLGIVLKELKESLYWIQLIKGVAYVETIKLEPLLQESEESIKIISKSLVTAKKNKK